MCLKQEIIHSTCAATDREREGLLFFLFFYKNSVRTAERSQSSDINQFKKTTQNRYCRQVCGGGEVVFEAILFDL